MTRVSVVMIIVAIEAAFSRAERVTLSGSRSSSWLPTERYADLLLAVSGEAETVHE